MTLHHPNPSPNPFVRVFRRIYSPLGFHHGYNFTLWLISSLALLGFLLARAPYMNVTANYLPHASPGEAYYFSQSYYRIGISIHLLTVIPGGFLDLLQFVPWMRHHLTLFHRVNGYVVILLVLVSNVGAVMIVRRAFGGTIATQAATGLLAIATTTGLVLAVVNIKRLQIEQHRAWMLRTWFLLGGSIITTRLILIIAVQIVSVIGSYYQTMPCEQIAWSGGDVDKYAGCGGDGEGYAAVHVDFQNAEGVEEVAAAFELTFGMALWMAIGLHAVGVEVYLRLTSAEGERLRQVSYERQVERGMRSPGREGLTADRLGDVIPWTPRVEEAKDEEEMKSERVVGVPA